jgi:hypothetical protein
MKGGGAEVVMKERVEIITGNARKVLAIVANRIINI